MAPFLKLQAVNQMLRAIGEEEVASLNSGLPDAEAALRTLERVTMQTLDLGWQQTTQTLTLSPDSNGRIPVPTDALRIDSTRNARIRVSQQAVDTALYLYNDDDQTYTFTRPLEVEIVWSRDFDLLTYALRRYIAAAAAVKFQQDEMGASGLDKKLENERDVSWVSLLDSEAEVGDSNLLLDSPHCRAMTRRNSRLYGAI